MAKGPKIVIYWASVTAHDWTVDSFIWEKVLLALKHKWSRLKGWSRSIYIYIYTYIYWQDTCYWDVSFSVSMKQHLSSPLKSADLVQGSVAVVCTSSPPPCYNCAIAQSGSTLRFRYMNYQTCQSSTELFQLWKRQRRCLWHLLSDCQVKRLAQELTGAWFRCWSVV